MNGSSTRNHLGIRDDCNLLFSAAIGLRFIFSPRELNQFPILLKDSPRETINFNGNYRTVIIQTLVKYDSNVSLSGIFHIGARENARNLSDYIYRE